MPNKTQRLCKMCGRTFYYSGHTSMTFCSEGCITAFYQQMQDDADEHPENHPNWVVKKCKDCGKTVRMNRRSYRCMPCQHTKKIEAWRACALRCKNGTVRRIGSDFICKMCGNPFKVSGPAQYLCPSCAKTAKHEYFRNYYAKKAEHISEYKTQLCIDCGKEFFGKVLREEICPECKKIRLRRYNTEYVRAKRQKKKEERPEA